MRRARITTAISAKANPNSAGKPTSSTKPVVGSAVDVGCGVTAPTPPVPGVPGMRVPWASCVATTAVRVSISVEGVAVAGWLVAVGTAITEVGVVTTGARVSCGRRRFCSSFKRLLQSGHFNGAFGRGGSDFGVLRIDLIGLFFHRAGLLRAFEQKRRDQGDQTQQENARDHDDRDGERLWPGFWLLRLGGFFQFFKVVGVILIV